MKKTVITALLALVALAGQAQVIRTNEPTLDDYLHLLNAFQSVGGGGFNNMLKLQPVFAPEMPTKQAYRYESRPFELIAPVETGKLIPLVLFGSYWYEEETGVSRFCGDKQIKPDLSSDLIKSIPHFYVLGIRII